MKARSRTFYHITTIDRHANILRTGGIDPKYSTGVRHYSWYVTWAKVPWAILHILQRHRVRLSDCVVLRVTAPRDVFCFSGRKGVYRASTILLPSGHYKAETLLYRALFRGGDDVNKTASL